jgi:hypothetical protein
VFCRGIVLKIDLQRVLPLTLLGCFLLLSPPLSVQGAEKGRGDYLTLKIALRGPGDELYFWWGHIALIVEDALSGQSRFYDYGLFSFDSSNFFVNFAFGRLLYSCGVSDAASNLRHYELTNRDITIYTLDLPPRKKEAVLDFVEWNVLPENRNYYYHHFRDNCATRIRDIVDSAVDGQFREQFGTAPGRYTLRQHVRRHTWFSPFFDWFLNFCMGQDIDRPITVWEEMFLPSEIGRRIEDFRYRDSGGAERRLVSSVEVLYRAVNRPPVLEVPRRQWPRELLLALILGAVFFTVRMGGIKKPEKKAFSRIFLGIGQSLLGVFFGAAGLILFFLIFFTNHDYAYHNSNLLYVNPLLLAALPLGICLAGRDPKRSRAAGQLLKGLWTYVFFGGLLSMGIKLFPWFYQQNQVTQALVLPIALSLSFIPDWIAPFLRGKTRGAGG